MSKLGRYSADRKKIEALSANKTIEVADCGTVFTLEGNSALTVTLLAPADAGNGWWCKFIANADHNNADHIITSNTANMHVAHVCTADGAAGVHSASTAQLKMTLEGAQTEIGDQIEVVCDGTSYFVTVIASSATALAIATS